MFQRIPVLLLLLISPISSAATAQVAVEASPPTPTLKAGTDVTLRSMVPFSPKHARLGDQVNFNTVWPLVVGSTQVWHSNHPVVGRVTSLTPPVEITLDPLPLSTGTVKFAGHPFEVLGYGNDRPPRPPTKAKASQSKSTIGDKTGEVLGGTILLGAGAVGKAAHFIAHPFGGSSADHSLPAGTVTVVKVAEDVPIVQTQDTR
jgi:hypothetical protein